MPIIKKTITQLVVEEINTDQFTRTDWLEFIKANISPMEIKRTIENDLFPFERLKARAIAAYELAQEFQL